MNSANSQLNNFLLKCFQYSLTGRMGHGLVHNLNGPLQILSMQIEMLKMGLSQEEMRAQGGGEKQSGSDFIVSARERVEEISRVIARLESMIHIIGYRGENQQEEMQKRPVEIGAFIRDFIEFWQADLYFKHRVEKEINIPETAIFAVMEESVVLSMLDGLMAAFLYCIKRREGASFFLDVKPIDSGGCRIEMGHSGEPVQDEICSIVTTLREEYVKDRESALIDCSTIPKYPPDLMVGLILGAVRSVDAGWSFDLSPERVVVSSGE